MSEGFDALIHAPQRLRICAFLHALSSAEFSAVRDLLGAADSVVSKHLKALVDAGYVEVTRSSALGRQRTWVALTPAGRAAYRGHVEALRGIVAL